MTSRYSFPLIDSFSGANLVKRPSIAHRAKKWASDVKQTTQSIRLARNRDSQTVSTYFERPACLHSA